MSTPISKWKSDILACQTWLHAIYSKDDRCLFWKRQKGVESDAIETVERPLLSDWLEWLSHCQLVLSVSENWIRTRFQSLFATDCKTHCTKRSQQFQESTWSYFSKDNVKMVMMDKQMVKTAYYRDGPETVVNLELLGGNNDIDGPVEVTFRHQKSTECTYSPVVPPDYVQVRKVATKEFNNQWKINIVMFYEGATQDEATESTLKANGKRYQLEIHWIGNNHILNSSSTQDAKHQTRPEYILASWFEQAERFYLLNGACIKNVSWRWPL